MGRLLERMIAQKTAEMKERSVTGDKDEAEKDLLTMMIESNELEKRVAGQSINLLPRRRRLPAPHDHFDHRRPLCRPARYERHDLRWMVWTPPVSLTVTITKSDNIGGEMAVMSTLATAEGAAVDVSSVAGTLLN
ncbi:hypothetical protein BC936DRAFT_147407 [Jimgerdemannia flammicorona]|uniref:Uncharacterized protein n=1 Tax=Jimgerdemannia flammicorona TaxID=994334 RepID=A0A433D5F9_9FUNG|nr:hypothetical protein BC936DRAFT_147407 [Jimgerdemannia flammicorona]